IGDRCAVRFLRMAHFFCAGRGVKRRGFVAGVVAVCLLCSRISYGRPYGIVVSEETAGISE
ncbi:MAG: hypothetical protein KAR36_07445, partial [Candidatus Latescibacteria bacterium]|nr:hypothetical protein [Candidatus Latescibacterota bacterium]